MTARSYTELRDRAIQLIEQSFTAKDINLANVGLRAAEVYARLAAAQMEHEQRNRH